TVQPQLADSAERLPTGASWLHEIKFDGYRILCFVDEGRVRLQTRNGLDWTHRFPGTVEAVRQLPIQSALLDGELAGVLANGVSSLPVLEASLQTGATQSLVYFAFDLLYLNGYDLRHTPLERRKQQLQQVLVNAPTAIQYVDHLEGDPAN